MAAAILGSNVHDIAITGNGTIDGNGTLWWTQCAGHSLNSSGWSTCGRPGLLTMNPVTNLLISGPRFLNSPCHNLVIRQSQDVEIGHVKVEAPPSYDQMEQSNNTDGIDVDGDTHHDAPCAHPTHALDLCPPYPCPRLVPTLPMPCCLRQV